MAEVCIAACTADLRTHHAMGHITVGGDGITGRTIPEAGPTGAGIKFGVGVEQISSAADALVGPFALVVPVDACKSTFSAAFSGHLELFWTELLAPLVLRALHFGAGINHGSVVSGHHATQCHRSPGAALGPEQPVLPPPQAVPAGCAGHRACLRAVQGAPAIGWLPLQSRPG